MNFFTRQAAQYKNELASSLASLHGIAIGIMADQQLCDAEVQFLALWLEQHSAIANEWPGDILHKRVRETLADGLITAEEREHLIETLQQLTGNTLDDLASDAAVSDLAFDDQCAIQIPESAFCLTGDFVFGPRSHCTDVIEKRGGIVAGGVSKKVRYVVVGSLGSKEWKNGGWGTKIEAAVKLQRKGAPIAIVREDRWAACL